jgi:hypothetical protein
MMIQHPSGGARGAAASSKGQPTLPLMALLFRPSGRHVHALSLTHADHVKADEVLRHKAPYLNTGFFLARRHLLRRLVGPRPGPQQVVKRQDDGEMAVNLPIQRPCGFGPVFYALTMTFAVTGSSINPHWY